MEGLMWEGTRLHCSWQWPGWTGVLKQPWSRWAILQLAAQFLSVDQLWTWSQSYSYSYLIHDLGHVLFFLEVSISQMFSFCDYVCIFFLSGRDFVEEKLGSKYVMGRAIDFATSFEESGPATPMFFILSPGVDPLKDVENQGKQNLLLEPILTSPLHSLGLWVLFSRFKDHYVIRYICKQ